MGMRVIPRLGGDPIFTPVHGLDSVHFNGTGLCECRRMLNCLSRSQLQEFHMLRERCSLADCGRASFVFPVHAAGSMAIGQVTRVDIG